MLIFLHKKIGIFLILFTFSAFDGKAQATLNEKIDVPLFAFDEIPVRVMIEGYKLFYIDAIYGNNKILFVNVEDLFNTLNIPCISSINGNSISGFIEKESQTYFIDFNKKQLKIGTKTIDIKNGIRTSQ